MDADVVVVGAGSAGCVLAARLSEDPRRRVLLLEAGEENRSIDVRRPNRFSLLLASACNWGYATVRQSACNWRVIDCPRGKLLGGTSAINAMVHVRGDRFDFDHWEALGATGWNWDSVHAAFIKAEKRLRSESTPRSGDGPLTLSSPRAPHPLSTAFVRAAVAAGHPHNEDFSGPSILGAGLYQRTIDEDGLRCSSADAYLEPARSRPNLQIVTGAHALRLRFDGRRCIGVDVLVNGGFAFVGAHTEVVVCAGAIDSPRLLMRSGVGDPCELESLGIEVVSPLPEVGRNLQDHPAFGLLFEPRERHEIAADSNFAEAGLFMRSEHHHDPGFDADLQLNMLPAAPVLAALRGQPRGMAIAVSPCRPRSRGRVWLRSANPFDAPLIDPAYLSEARDIALIMEGVRAVRSIVRAEPLASLLASELAPGSGVSNDEQLDRAIRASADCVWHPVGTCRMGNDPSAVVDPRLRIQGVDCVRVADASVMPQITSANTNAPTIMIGERAAQLILHPE